MYGTYAYIHMHTDTALVMAVVGVMVWYLHLDNSVTAEFFLHRPVISEIGLCNEKLYTYSLKETGVLLYDRIISLKQNGWYSLSQLTFLLVFVDPVRIAKDRVYYVVKRCSLLRIIRKQKGMLAAFISFLLSSHHVLEMFT